MSNTAIASIQGARTQNEDYELVLENDNYAVILMLDGHGGKDMKSVMGDKIKEKLENFIACTPKDEEYLSIIAILKAIYYSTIEYVDTLDLQAGTTLSLGVFQKVTRNFFTIQLGDSTIFIADSHSGEIIECSKIFAADDALPEKEFELGYQQCITNTHDFTKEDEINLYLSSCRKSNLPIVISQRTDAAMFEERYQARVKAQFLPEPSRTIEPKSYYTEHNIEELRDIQRTPEFSVWYVEPEFTNLALCAVCDGFVSKKALSTFDKVAQVLINPGFYIQEPELLDGTLVGHWLQTKSWWDGDYIKPSNKIWKSDPILYANKLVHKIAPDQKWKNAVKTSLEKIEEIRGRNPQETVRACLDLQNCVDMAVQIPISIASDDNVSCCVILV